MNFKHLVQLDYWFGQPFSAQGLTLWFLVGGFLVLIITGLVAKIVAQYQEDKFKKIILKRSGSIGIGMGFLGMVWMFFRQEGIIFLSWRFWLLMWVLVLGWRLYRVLKYATHRIPDMKTEESNRARIEKYLPKSKK
jgi:hypothetical protein